MRQTSALAFMVAVVAFVVIGIAVEFFFLPAILPSNGPRLPSGQPVKTALNQWAADLNSLNVTGLAKMYSPNATVAWTGTAAGLTGTYNGRANIMILYGSSIGKTSSTNASISNYVQKSTKPSDANVTFTLDMKGNSTVWGEYDARANASQQWTYADGRWQILKETWDYSVFNVQFPQEGTTFPQWTAIIEGKSPDLVPDKSLEWHAGPYVAASAYALLGAVVAIGLINFRRKQNPSETATKDAT
jgi:hypothetical protein